MSLADRARAMIRSALEEMSRADALVRESLRGVSDQTLIGVVDRTRQQLVDAGAARDQLHSQPRDNFAI